MPSALGFPAGCHRYIRSTRSNGLLGPLKPYCASCMRAKHTLGGNKLFTKEKNPPTDAISLKFATNLGRLGFPPSDILALHFSKTLPVFLGMVFSQYLGD